MNKLISKNPVQRFKQGKKIQFAKVGDKFLYNGEEVVEEILNGQTILRRKNGTYIYPSNRNLTKLNGESYRRVPTAPQTRVFTNTDRYTPLPWEEPRIIKYGSFNNSQYVTNANPNSRVNNVRVDQPNSTQNTQTNQKSKNQNKSNPQKSAKTSFNTKQQKTNNIFIKGFQNRRGEIKDVKAMQNQLIKLGLLKDRFGADGKWGKNTEAAYQKYLQYLNNPSGISTSQTPIIEREISPYEQISNNQENTPLYQRIIFKQGGQLISKNPVERFKQGKKIVKAQQGKTLPTAPKAEDRYKDSYKSWNWPQFKEVTAGSILFPGAKISQTIEDSDTTYMETPPRFPFVKVVPRVAKNNTKTIEWRDLITGQTYPEVRRGNSREYEILKRRFNTAWNLAK